MSLSPRPVSPLARFTNSIKSTDKSKRNPAETLLAIIDEYTQTGEFDQYITYHAEDVSRYLKPDRLRPGRWRASSAGRCCQQQCFDNIEKEKPGRFKRSKAVQRKSETLRALANGTFTHIRWHLLFDALQEAGTVQTLFAEDMRIDKERKLSGTVDRVIQYEFEGKQITVVLDFKSMKDSYWNPLLQPTAENELQQCAYDILGYKADFFGLLYENKDNHRLKIYIREYNGEKVSEVYDNLRKLNNWTDLVLAGAIDDQLPPLPLITTWCQFCPWTEACKKLNPGRGT